MEIEVTHSPLPRSSISSCALAHGMCTSLINQTLAEAIGSLDITFHRKNPSTPSTTDDSQSSTSDTLSDNEESSDAEDDEPNEPRDNALVSSFIIPDQAEYPLLSSLVSMHKCHNHFASLLYEAVQFYNMSDTAFKHGNNTEATVLSF